MNVNQSIPHNILAEQAYIAHVLMDPEKTLNNVAITISPEDFFDAKHQLIYETATMLHDSYKTVNPIEVVTALKNAGRLADAGGIQYITQAVNPSNTTAYGTNPVGLAVLIKEDKQRRDLLDAAYRISEAATTGSGNNADEAMSIAESEIFTLVNAQVKDVNYDFTVADMAGDVLQSIRELAEAPEGSTPNGVPSGFDALDDMTTGFKGGQFILIAARPGIGKALCVETSILTTKGYKLLKDIAVGDYVYGMNGKPYKVVKAHDTFLADDTYKLTFSNNSTITANGKHVWLTETRQARKQRNTQRARQKNFTASQTDVLIEELNTTSPSDLMSIEELETLMQSPVSKKLLVAISGLDVQSTKASAVTVKRNLNTYSVSEVMENLESAKRVQEHTDATLYTKVANYVHSHQGKEMTVNDITELLFDEVSQESVTYIRNLISNRSISPKGTELTAQEKIEPQLLYSKAELLHTCIAYGELFKNDQRTDNSVLSAKTTTEIYSSVKIGSDNRNNHSIPSATRLQEAVYLGESFSVEDREEALAVYPEKKLTTSDEKLFRFMLFAAASLGYSTAQSYGTDVYTLSWKVSAKSDIYITDVEKAEPTMMRCLTVDSPDSMFLAGESLVPTHNSTLAVDFSRNASFLDGKTVLFFSLEMDQKELTTRILSAEARVETTRLKKGTLEDIDWMNLAEAEQKLQNGNFILKTNPNLTISQLRAACMKQKMQPEGLDMVVIDYLQLLDMDDRIPRQQAVSNVSRALKLLAKELDVPIIVLSQLNRKSEDRQDGKPSVSDLRESGSLEQDADIVFLLHRPEATDPNNRPGQTDLIIGKHRGGPVGTVPLTSMLQFSKFVPGTGMIEREEFGDDDNMSEASNTEVAEEPW